MTRLIGKLLVGVAGGVVVWFLTQSDQSPFAGPDVELASPTVPVSMAAREEFRVSYAVTNQRNRDETGCGSYVLLEPVGDGDLSLDEQGEQPARPAEPATRPGSALPSRPLVSNELSSPPDARQVSDLSVNQLRAITQSREVPTITKKPEITQRFDRLKRPEITPPQQAGAPPGECRTGRNEFDLSGAAGSSIQVLANCRAARPGTYRMTYGVSCERFWDWKWHLQGEAHIDVEG